MELSGSLDFMIGLSQHSPKKFDKIKENERYLALLGYGIPHTTTTVY